MGITKRTIEIVKKEFDERNLLLLADEYINNNTRMPYKCKFHAHKIQHITYGNFSQGKGCAYCANRGSIAIEDAYFEFKKRGYKLLEECYINSNTKMKYLCFKHPNKDISITLSSLKSGRGCPYCSGNKVDFEDVYQSFLERGYTLLVNEFVNAKTKMKFYCPEHPNKDLWITWDKFSKGQGCKYCGKEQYKLSRKIPFHFVKTEFEKRGYTLLENDYINSNTKMKYICPLHPDKDLSISYSNLRKGVECAYCAFDKRSGEGHHNWKGGISSIAEYLRIKLNEWRKFSIESCKSRCVITEGRFDAIHHLYSFNKIVEETFSKLNIKIFKNINDYSVEQLNLIERIFLNTHQQYPLGVCLREDVHLLYHSIYGFDNTPEQFEEFKLRYRNGEFKEVI